VSRIAVFGYASLVSTASAAETLGRPVEPIPARLRGWRRAWTLARDNAASEKTFARPDGSEPAFCLGLNVEPAGMAANPNGALIELTERELERLDRREMRYLRVEVGASIETAEPFDAVFVYSARAEHRRPVAPADSIVVASYQRTVAAAFAALGPGQLELFERTTAAPPTEVTEATLVRDRIPPGNPRAW
jgi:cation transport regulator ChaC